MTILRSLLNHPGQLENYRDREPYRSNYREIPPSTPRLKETRRILSDTLHNSRGFL